MTNEEMIKILEKLLGTLIMEYTNSNFVVQAKYIFNEFNKEIEKLKETKITPQQRAEVWKESTANGLGEYFHKLWMDSLFPRHEEFLKFLETLAQEEEMKQEFIRRFKEGPIFINGIKQFAKPYIYKPKGVASPLLEEPETFDFYEAVRRLLNGKKLIPVDWMEGQQTKSYYMIDLSGDIIFYMEGKLLSKTSLNDLFKHRERTWKEVKAQPKTFGWDEAYRLMKEGKGVRREGWVNKECFMLIDNNSAKFENPQAVYPKHYFPLTTEDLDATDWYVYGG